MKKNSCNVSGMRKLMSLIWAGMFVPAGSLWAQDVAELHNLGYVVISLKGPTDGGDFGPQTPGTKTSGFQEAIDFAVANQKDIFVIGGGIAEMTPLEGGYIRIRGPVWYILNATLYIPAAENFRIVGGSFSLGSRCDGDVMVIDSQKNFEFACDLVGNGEILPGKVIIRIKPQTPRPDGVIGFTHSTINVVGTIGGGTVMGGMDGKRKDGTGIGLQLDASAGPIAFNTFHITEINACHEGLVLEKGDIHSNVFEMIFDHATNYPIVVKTGSYNRIKSLVDPSGTGIYASPIGVSILGGKQNLFDLIINNGFDNGNAIVFGPEARDNLVYTRGLSPEEGITNNAKVATNKVILSQPLGFSVLTPPFPQTGAFLENRFTYTVLATIKSPGDVNDWTQTDVNGITQTVPAGLYAGQLICLEPGDKLSFHYRIAPRWAWQALR